MHKCEVCNKEFSRGRTLGRHIQDIHKISTEFYFLKYIGNKTTCLICGEDTAFLDFSRGYSPFCKNESCKKEYRRLYLSKYRDDNKEKVELERFGKVGLSYEEKSKIKNQKREKTWLKKYGVKNPLLHREAFEDKLKSKQLQVVKDFLETKSLELISEYKDNKTPFDVRCKMCGHIYSNYLGAFRANNNLCPICHPAKFGRTQMQIAEFISEFYSGEISINNRTIIAPLELDIVLPDLKLAIEYHGCYWHSEKFIKGRSYHLKKLKAANALGYRLIQIFEDEWLYKTDIVKSRIKHIIGHPSTRLHARKCEIREVETKVKTQFLEQFHIQGAVGSKYNIGAYHNDELVAIMTFGLGRKNLGVNATEGSFELLRFATHSDYHIPGIAGKLLNYFKKTYEWEEIYSYADRRWSEGNVYKSIGFEEVGTTDPGYFYVRSHSPVRENRFIHRKRKDEPIDISERDLRESEGLFRIWDCGTIKFTLKKLA